jgi:hypothetical protein
MPSTVREITYHVKLLSGMSRQVSRLAKEENRTIHNMLKCLIGRGILYTNHKEGSNAQK